jgi:hypothetical protein
MERDFSGSRMGRADFGRLAKLCGTDPKFPANYDAWLKLVADGERQTIAEGKAVIGFDVDPADFEAWCHRLSIHVCFDALRAYLIVTRRALLQAQAQAQPGAAPAPVRKPSSGDSGAKRRASRQRTWPLAPLAVGLAT